jgi:hypothetical protein
VIPQVRQSPGDKNFKEKAAAVQIPKYALRKLSYNPFSLYNNYIFQGISVDDSKKLRFNSLNLTEGSSPKYSAFNNEYDADNQLVDFQTLSSDLVIMTQYM